MWGQRCGPPECTESLRGPARSNPGSRAEPAAGTWDPQMPRAKGTSTAAPGAASVPEVEVDLYTAGAQHHPAFNPDPAPLPSRRARELESGTWKGAPCPPSGPRRIEPPRTPRATGGRERAAERSE
eukprot:9091624-Alexandrium_andersonii.AAC.1